MQHPLHEIVKRLNRLKRLYDNAVFYGTPYRVSRSRKLYERFLLSTIDKYHLKEFGPKTYHSLFGLKSNLEIIRLKKEESINNRDYELAAFFRDQEKRLLMSLLYPIGVKDGDRFFAFGDEIYEIQ